MRVICRSTTDRPGGSASETPWLTIGSEYTVLEMLARSVGGIDLHLPTDSPGDLGWFPSTSFVTVDDSTPSTWVTQIDEDGNLSVGPKSWLSPGFWERFYDGDGVAVEIVRHELEALTSGVPLWARKTWLDR